ncbi:SDR family oxidoreductase [Sphingomonas sp. AOB5]|uniref:SDR family oxidoreductase n=1 Tax=Sphingomonas sp. AOB5 TaxID=3034017 RepID=UPI0023F997BF|nr:SDR family oxidoreductase [Sphingomonas sp. AOB5]MDF7774391.1 SDR family oxidoreductase [Sphingomonas sp. AOB5]
MPAPLALVTGGHKRIGAAIAAALAAKGYAVAIHGSRDADPSPELLAAFEASSADWRGFTADFTDPAAAAALMAEASAHFGRPPELLVNNASTFGADRFDDVTHVDLMTHYAVNCAAPVLLSQAFAASGSQDDNWSGRSIVNILDQRIAHPHGDQFAYTLSKIALEGATRAMARVLAPGIRVNAVAPGLTLATEDYSDAQTARLGERMPLGSLSTAQQIADAVLYLAGAEGTTGQTVYVDGGAHMIAFDRDFMHMDR